MGLVGPATTSTEKGLVASSHDATSPCDLLQGLVAGTSPIVCANLLGPKGVKVSNILSRSL